MRIVNLFISIWNRIYFRFFVSRREAVGRRLDKVLMIEKDNVCVMYFADGQTFTLNSGSHTSIARFYDWFMSDVYYNLLSDEAFAQSMEDTQVIEIKKVS